jgi:hypothetical protein
MIARLIIMLVLILTGSVLAFGQDGQSEAISSIITAGVVLLLSLATAIVRRRTGKGTLLKLLTDRFYSVLSQEEIDMAIETALSGKFNTMLNDAIGDVVSSIVEVGANGENLSVVQFVKAVVVQLRAYSPDVLRKVFTGLTIAWDNRKVREATLSQVETSAKLQEAVHSVIHQVK